MLKTFFIAILLISCAASKTQKAPSLQVPAVLIDKDFKDLPKYSPVNYALLQYAIQADTLKLKVLCPCQNIDSFRLVTNRKLMKSLPPQMNLYLLRNDTTVSEKPEEKELRFDISALKIEEYEKLILNINNTNQKIGYVY